MSSNRHEHTYTYSPESLSGQESFDSKEEAFEGGRRYYELFLKDVLPKMLVSVDTLRDKHEVNNASVQCIFLDRDGRAAMYGFEHYKNGIANYDVTPLPVSTIITGSLFDEYRRFDDLNYGEIDDPTTWSNELEKRFDGFLKYYQEAQQWIDVIHQTLDKKLASKQLLVIIDIGFRGSAVEVAKYLLHKAFEDKQVESLLIYKSSDKIPINSLVSNETTWYAEEAIPHSTSGYKLTNDKYVYIKEGAPSEIETAFYRGVIDAARSA